VPTQVGNYSVRLIQSPCDNLSQSFAYTTVGINELESEFSIYPNPVKTKLYIKNNPLNNWTTVEIINNEGKSLHNEALKNYINELDFSKYVPGVYLIVLSNSTKKQQFKVVKE
jgi:hypothetical protein